MVAAIIAVAVTVYVRLPRGGALPRVSPLPPHVDLALRKVRYSETRKGVKQWDLQADSAEYDRGGEILHLTNISFTLYRPTDPRTIILTAREGQYFPETRNIILHGSVHVRTATGMTVATESARYTAETGTVSTTDHARLGYLASHVEGEGMEISVAEGTIRILKDVSAVLQHAR